MKNYRKTSERKDCSFSTTGNWSKKVQNQRQLTSISKFSLRIFTPSATPVEPQVLLKLPLSAMQTWWLRLLVLSTKKISRWNLAIYISPICLFLIWWNDQSLSQASIKGLKLCKYCFTQSIIRQPLETEGGLCSHQNLSFNISSQAIQ